MKWITREHVKVDRVACPWLIKKFVDRDAEFVFVPKDKVAEERWTAVNRRLDPAAAPMSLEETDP